MNESTNETSDLYALLIGVDYYMPNVLPDNSFYPSLGGCVRDVAHVEAFLKRELGLQDDHLLKLTSTRGTGNEPAGPKEGWPTYENIVNRFKELTKLAQPGDQVYIQYSGHGGRAKTMFEAQKGANAYDETLVPTDIGNSEARYLRDVEMVKLLNDMVDKGLVVTVVLDCCHSGGMTRGPAAEDVAIRGVSFIDETARPTDSLVATGAELAELVAGGQTRNVTLGSGWLPEPEGYVMLAACRPNEFAYEAAFEGTERNGALTYWLLDSLQDLGPGLSYKLLHDRILPKVHSRFEEQTPQLQGEGDRVVFGSERIKPVYAAPVIQVDTANKRLLIGAGQAHGLRKGAQFAIYAHGTTDFSALDERQAVVEITELGAADSWVTVPEEFDVDAIEQGAQAVLIGAGSVKLVRQVCLAHRDDLPPDIDQQTVLKAVEEALEGNGWVEVTEGGVDTDYQVAVNENGAYEIWNRSGQPVTNLRPPLKIDDDNAAADVARRLVHLSKYHTTLQLENKDPMSPLARKLVVELVGKQEDYDPADGPEPQPFDDPGGTPTLKVGEWTFLRVRNDSSQVLNVTVLDLQPDWGVSQVYPSGAGDFFVALDPDQEQVLPLRASLPGQYEEGTDTVKVFATVGTTNFRWLELPSLDQPQVRSAAVRSKAPANPLEQMLAAVTAEQPPTRNLNPAAYPSREWTTAQVEVHMQK